MPRQLNAKTLILKFLFNNYSRETEITKTNLGWFNASDVRTPVNMGKPCCEIIITTIVIIIIIIIINFFFTALHYVSRCEHRSAWA